MIVDFPELSPTSWHFLNSKEADFVVARIEHDRADIEVEPFHLSTYLRNGLDLKIWGFSMLYVLTTTNSYAIAYFLPIILRDGMGFDIAKAQCLVAPPYVAAAIVMFVQAYYGDKWHLRGPIIIFNAAMGMSSFFSFPPSFYFFPPFPSSPPLTSPPRNPRPRPPRLYNQPRRPLLRRLPRHNILQRQLSRPRNLPSQQRPGPMEARLDIRNPHRRRRHRRDHRHHSL